MFKLIGWVFLGNSGIILTISRKKWFKEIKEDWYFDGSSHNFWCEWFTNNEIYAKLWVKSDGTIADQSTSKQLDNFYLVAKDHEDRFKNIEQYNNLL